ncbi:MAG: DNA replication/repair protein RecF [Clostridiales bacterium]|nr:DNA replication/repair protein RecF [Clostridiales bacterium]
MKVTSLSWEGFRNLKKGSLLPAPGVNVLYGDNAQGKTNLLEGLWLFTGGKSFRGAKDGELIGFGCQQAILSLQFTAQEREQEAEITVEKRRQAVLNGVFQPTASRLTGVFGAVVFSPVHLGLVKDGPDGRRRFLDAACCQLRPAYISALAAYNRALNQRNALLKDMTYHADLGDMLEVWDVKLAQAGGPVLAARQRYVDRLRRSAAETYDGLSGGRERLTVSYKATAGESPDRSEPQEGAVSAWWAARLCETFRSRREADRAAGFTTAGPHRDDLALEIDDLPARAYASQGQQRSVALALKLAEAALLEEAVGEKPVVLLDDVMSELDFSRQDYLLNRIGEGQVFITCCDPTAVLRLTGGRAFHVEQGQVRPMEPVIKEEKTGE